MASMNNWLGFSLSPQELPPQAQDDSRSSLSRLGFNSDEISGNDISRECFDITSDSTVPSPNVPAPFSILEAFNRNNHSQDWNMKDMAMNSDNNYKTTSDFSMLMGSSCSGQNLDNHGPKLENFLGGHSFADHGQKLSGCSAINSAYNGTGHYMYPNCSLELPSEPAAPSAAKTITDDFRASNVRGSGTNSNNTIGLSMIKNWLRNQPTPAQPEIKNDGGGGIVGSVGRITSAQTLSLSMSTESHMSSGLPLLAASGGGGGGAESTMSLDNKQKGTSLDAQTGAIEAVPRKSIDTFGQRTSIYRGVTRHRWTGRYEAHLWDNSCRREGQTRKGRQVYLGGYDKEEKAARAYDLAALKYWGTTTTTNFPISNYENEVEEMKHMTRQEYVASLRRKSSGFSRGASIYRGVTRHHQHGRWQARIGRVAGNKDLYLGTFSTQEEAAEAYDIAAIKFRGLNAVTNFDMSRYDVKSIIESSTLPIGGAAKRLKDAEQAEMITIDAQPQRAEEDNINSQLADGMISSYGAHHGWPTIPFQQVPPFSMHYPYGNQRVWCKQEQDLDPDPTHTHTFQDLNHLQLGSTHNFFQPSVLHNLMNLDSSSMEHSSASNSAIYCGGNESVGNGGFHQGVGYGGNGGFVMPIATVIAQEGNNPHGNVFGDGDIKALGYENMFGSSSDPYYNSRNLYYLPQQSSLAGAVKMAAAGVDDQGSACNNWVPTAVASPAPRASSMAVCHGSQAFTVWNDT